MLLAAAQSESCRPSVHVIRSIIAQVERDLENSSFLSAYDCVSVANTILHLKLTGRTDLSLGYDEALMLVTSTRREVRLAYLLLMDLYYSTNRGTFAECLFQELYNSSTDGLEKILLLNAMMAMGGVGGGGGGAATTTTTSGDVRSSAQIKCLSADLKHASTNQLKTQLQIFNDNITATILRSPTNRPPAEILNRLLVYLAHTQSLTDGHFLELNFASHLSSTTCNTLCQLLRSRIRVQDIDFVPLIPSLLRRMIQTIETNEDTYLTIPDPWFLTNALKVLRAFFPTRYIAHESDLLSTQQGGSGGGGGGGVSTQGTHPPHNHFSSGHHHLQGGHDFMSGQSRMSSRFQRSASLLLSFSSKNPFSRRGSDPSDQAMNNEIPKSIPALLSEMLSKILEFRTNYNFTTAQYRHYRNVLSMVKAEACRLIYAIQPSDYWLDQATEETILQFRTLNTNTIRNAIATWTIAAQDPTLILSQNKIVTNLVERLSQTDVQSFIKVRIARLLVQIAISDIMVNGLTTFEDQDFFQNPEGENCQQINQAGDNCYDPTFVMDAVTTAAAAAAAAMRQNGGAGAGGGFMNGPPTVSPHTILNIILLALGKRDPKSIKIQLTQCACSLIRACQTIDEETIVPVISELLTFSSDVWSTILPLIEDDKIATKVLSAGENIIRQHVWQNQAMKIEGEDSERMAGGGGAGGVDRQFLGWLKLTLHLIGRFGLCHITDELQTLFKGWSSSLSDQQYRNLDQEAVCLVLITARKIYLGCESSSQQILKNLVNGFLSHEDIAIQTAATETWLIIRAASFPTCA